MTVVEEGMTVVVDEVEVEEGVGTQVVTMTTTHPHVPTVVTHTLVTHMVVTRMMTHTMTTTAGRTHPHPTATGRTTRMHARDAPCRLQIRTTTGIRTRMHVHLLTTTGAVHHQGTRTPLETPMTPTVNQTPTVDQTPIAEDLAVTHHRPNAELLARRPQQQPRIQNHTKLSCMGGSCASRSRTMRVLMLPRF